MGRRQRLRLRWLWCTEVLTTLRRVQDSSDWADEQEVLVSLGAFIESVVGFQQSLRKHATVEMERIALGIVQSRLTSLEAMVEQPDFQAKDALDSVGVYLKVAACIKAIELQDLQERLLMRQEEWKASAGLAEFSSLCMSIAAAATLDAALVRQLAAMLPGVARTSRNTQAEKTLASLCRQLGLLKRGSDDAALDSAPHLCIIFEALACNSDHKAWADLFAMTEKWASCRGQIQEAQDDASLRAQFAGWANVHRDFKRHLETTAVQQTQLADSNMQVQLGNYVVLLRVLVKEHDEKLKTMALKVNRLETLEPIKLDAEQTRWFTLDFSYDNVAQVTGTPS